MGRRDDYVMPEVISRPVFYRYVWSYNPGEHVVFGGPSQISGKTQLALELLGFTVSVEMPAYIAVSKPRDKVTSYFAKLYNWKITREWPPSRGVREFFGKKYTGYVVWPHFGDLYGDRDKVATVLGKMIADRYGASARSSKDKPVNGIIVADDTRDKEKVLGLKLEMTIVLAMAGAMGLGLWVFVQKPSQAGDTALMAYSSGNHWFIFHDSTVTGRDYYADIGGIDPDYMAWVIERLGPRQALYICRDGPYCCIVDSDSPVGKISK